MIISNVRSRNTTRSPVSCAGGRPRFWQPHIRVSQAWRFFFQLDGCEARDDHEPSTLNPGGGTGYAFLSEDGLEGRFYRDSV